MHPRGAPAAAGALATPGRRAGYETVTLTLWHDYPRNAESQVVETRNGEFQETHPGVPITWTGCSFDAGWRQ